MANCKLGDIARIVVSDDGNYGRFVEVMEEYQGVRSREAGVWWVCNCASALRGADRILLPGEPVVIHDGALRPIRPGEGEDETFSWAGKPEGVPA